MTGGADLASLSPQAMGRGTMRSMVEGLARPHPFIVMPAHAGIQAESEPCANAVWTPAFAGVT